MPLMSVLDYVKGELDGLPCPNLSNAVAYLNPPVTADADVGQPQLFVWSSGVKEKRKTIPRQRGGVASSGGFKELRHSVAVYVLLIDDPSEAKAGTSFFQALDAVQAKLRAIDLPVTLTDPDTAVLTYLQEIGEDFDTMTDVVRSTASQAYVRFLARVTTIACEQLQS